MIFLKEKLISIYLVQIHQYKKFNFRNYKILKLILIKIHLKFQLKIKIQKSHNLIYHNQIVIYLKELTLLIKLNY